MCGDHLQLTFRGFPGGRGQKKKNRNWNWDLSTCQISILNSDSRIFSSYSFVVNTYLPLFKLCVLLLLWLNPMFSGVEVSN